MPKEEELCLFWRPHSRAVGPHLHNLVNYSDNGCAINSKASNKKKFGWVLAAGYNTANPRVFAM
jgi:hypothetical protein